MSNLCVAFNGPPGIGKDTQVDLILRTQVSEGQIARLTLAHMIRGMAAEHYGIPNFFTLSTDRETKDVHYEPLGMTPRQALIEYSESVIKRQLGRDYFAKRFAAEAAKHRVSMMTDLGFPEEATELVKVMDLLIIVQLHHPDFNFDNDSREYVNDSNAVVIRHQLDRGNPEREAYLINQKLVHPIEEKFR